jgi:hypothetical protein
MIGTDLFGHAPISGAHQGINQLFHRLCIDDHARPAKHG